MLGLILDPAVDGEPCGLGGGLKIHGAHARAIVLGQDIKKAVEKRKAALSPERVGNGELKTVTGLVFEPLPSTLQREIESVERAVQAIVRQGKVQRGSHLVGRLLACAGQRHGQSNGDAQRREKDVAGLGLADLVIKVHSEVGIALHKLAKLSGGHLGGVLALLVRQQQFNLR